MMRGGINSELLPQVQSAVGTSYKCRETHQPQVIGTIIGVFFVLEVLGMLTIVGIYSTYDFIGVCFAHLFQTLR